MNTIINPSINRTLLMPENLESYLINEETTQIKRALHTDYQSIVYETRKIFYVKESPFSIIEKSCLNGLSSYEGRRAAMIYLTSSKHKVPILINAEKRIFCFPSQSPRAFECSWIFYHHVLEIRPDRAGDPNISSYIIFKNGQQVPMRESYYTLQHQMMRTALCIANCSN
ncbi:competence protein ComK [Aquibacillus koreensis]|uniref:Competence protein ComK n=1 Tax=Aquibacillus koreensis TaxID=279446 RepID=A0A9X3WMC8_9BACI|nr:competence protein ComK [Aquibacillus koreensis]MCT2537048.1 competence protein ComK [Aquibacillus koreensis]MDC3419969.1 competence protein ComK [Aquibacillus koreensis]